MFTFGTSSTQSRIRLLFRLQRNPLIITLLSHTWQLLSFRLSRVVHLHFSTLSWVKQILPFSLYSYSKSTRIRPLYSHSYYNAPFLCTLTSLVLAHVHTTLCIFQTDRLIRFWGSDDSDPFINPSVYQFFRLFSICLQEANIFISWLCIPDLLALVYFVLWHLEYFAVIISKVFVQ